jgi:hypothetical protein
MNARYKSLLAKSIDTHKFQWLGLVLECSVASVLPAPLGALENATILLFPALDRQSTASCSAVSKAWKTGNDAPSHPRCLYANTLLRSSLRFRPHHISAVDVPRPIDPVMMLSHQQQSMILSKIKQFYESTELEIPGE